VTGNSPIAAAFLPSRREAAGRWRLCVVWSPSRARNSRRSDSAQSITRRHRAARRIAISYVTHQ